MRTVLAFLLTVLVTLTLSLSPGADYDNNVSSQEYDTTYSVAVVESDQAPLFDLLLVDDREQLARGIDSGTLNEPGVTLTVDRRNTGHRPLAGIADGGSRFASFTSTFDPRHRSARCCVCHSPEDTNTDVAMIWGRSTAHTDEGVFGAGIPGSPA